MKYFFFKDPLNLSRKQFIAVFLSSCLILFTAFIFEVSQQYNTATNNFYTNLDTLNLQQSQIEKNTETILDALSQYHASNLNRSNSEFEHFAQGLYKQSSTQNTNIYAIGFAKYLPKELAYFFKHEQQEKFLSINSQTQSFSKKTYHGTSKYALTVSIIIPSDTEHKTYLKEDLFNLPSIAAQFKAATKANKSHTELLQSSDTKAFYTLSLKPVYLSDPNTLSPQERLQQVIGVVFIIVPIEEIIFQNIKKLFPKENIFLKSDLPIENSPWFSKMIYQSDLNPSILYALEFHLHHSFALISTLPEKTRLNLELHWHLTDLKIEPLLITLYITLALYLTIILFSIIVFQHTKHLQQTQTRLTRIIATSQEAVIVTNKDGFVKIWNPIAIQLFGYTEAEALNQPIMQLIFNLPPNDLKTNPKSIQKNNLKYLFLKTFGINQNKSGNLKQELKLTTRTGKEITTEIAISVINNPKNPDNIEISFFIKDITYQRKTEVEIKQLAYFDPLTNLENRTFFKGQVEKAIHNNQYSTFAILFLDLDGFKKVNDSLGHSTGDELLIIIAKRIMNSLRDTSKNTQKNTHICRFGGDEFVLMIGNVSKQQATQIALRLLKNIERLVKLKHDELSVTCSIGIALYPQHGGDVDTLLRHADTAMYQSKNTGKNTYSIYNDEMEEQLSKRLLLEKHLKNALKLNEFSLAYQPKIDLLTGKIAGVEALIRWNNPILGLVPPDEFIPIAEESHLIIEIGNWVAQQCIQQLSRWKNTQNRDLHIAINVSSQQLQHPEFLQSLSDMMKQEKLAPQLLEIELTERTIMSNAEENIIRFNKIREQGFELSVDDFGTGYSSLSYLKKFPLSIIKIDKSFIDGLPSDEDDASIARAILSLSHNLNMRVVAEGVETLEQLCFLKTINCNLAQGYHISRPLSIQSLETWLAQNKDNFYHGSEYENKHSEQIT